MAEENGENFQQRPDWSHPLGLPDNDLEDTMSSMVESTTGRVYESLLGDNALEIAKQAIEGAGLVGVLGYTERAHELCELFERYVPPESAETAKLYAQYRLHRLRETSNVLGPEAEEFWKIIDEHRASPFQSLDAQQPLTYLAAELGHAPSFRLWLETALKLGKDRGFKAGVLHYDDMHKFGRILSQFVEMPYQNQTLEEIMRGALPEPVTRPQLLGYLAIVESVFEQFPGKARFADQLAHVIDLSRFSQDPPVAAAGAQLRLNMIVAGARTIEPDRNYVQHLTRQRPYNNLIRQLAVLSIEDTPIGLQAAEALQTMSDGGELSGRDEEIIEDWRQQAVPKPKRRRNRNRRRKR
jgi:hypothetical protein